MQAYPLHSVLESYDDPVTNAAIPNAQKSSAGNPILRPAIWQEKGGFQ